eukprot:Lithocolla_globosa_v1_NODE_2942_length_1815_cov_36.972159.p2 type:complete len:120 gc:universal NODE_2942_length_1815_cov_36.972159:1017-1376(+)
MPCFLRMLRKFFARVESMPAPMAGIYSTTVTSAPSLDQTEPNSRPMTPPPITIIFFGTSLRDRAPVESTMVSWSTSKPGKGEGSEPVARMMFLALTACCPPDARSTFTPCPPVRDPLPL